MLRVDSLWSQALRGVSAEFPPGQHVILGRPDDGLDELAECMSGVAEPVTGSVRIAGRAPYRDARLRCDIGSLLPTELPMPRGKLPPIVSRRMPKHSHQAATELLRTCGLLERQSQSLSADERRSIAFLLATSVTRPYLVLYEPLLRLPGVPTQAVLGRLRAQAAHGSTVIALTANPAHARELGGSSWLLDRGKLVSLAAEDVARGHGTQLELELVIECSAPKKLARSLLQLQGLGVHFDPNRPGQLVISSRRPETASLELMRAALEHEVELFSVTTRAPTVDQLRAAAAGRAHAAYSASVSQPGLPPSPSRQRLGSET